MSYHIKEIFYSIQGEGMQSGRPAVFCRFSGCNLWNGQEADRENAICNFCDTDFNGTDGGGGGVFESAILLAEHILSFWPKGTHARPFVICTGGEPLLQLDQKLIDVFHKYNFTIALETNGTLIPPNGIDWICVSPKMESDFILKSGDELKLVFPQASLDPAQFINLDFKHFLLQPMDGPSRDENIEKTVAYCHAHPHWQISLQMHKFLGLP